MPFAQYDFSFFYHTPTGKRSSFFSKRATLESDALYLDGEHLYFNDIYLLEREDNKIVFILYPACTLNSRIAEHILPFSNSFVIEVSREFAFDIKSAIDRRYTEFRMKEKAKLMRKKDQIHNFRTACCPQCGSHIDLSYKAETPYIYCRHCKAIFNKSLYERDPEDFRICPQCDYYNRVQLYTEVNFYLTHKEEALSYHTHYACDSCAQKYFKKTFWKNLAYIVAAPFAAYAQLKSEWSQEPSLKDLTKANLLASEGNIEEARPYYDAMLLRVGEHPGVLYSYGKACLDASFMTDDNEQVHYLRQKAVEKLKKALQVCANYIPVIELMRENGNVEFMPRLIDDDGAALSDEAEAISPDLLPDFDFNTSNED
jgi:hypothetical protein